jgi:hypothetical protein
MNYSVTIDNNSGAAQTVAVFMTDAGGGYSLVWSVMEIPDTGSSVLSWRKGAFGLGWGTSAAPLDYGLRYVSGQAPVGVDPLSAQGNNTLPIGYNGGFEAGQPYRDRDPGPGNSVNLATDRSFTVGEAALMSVALYLEGSPALAMRGAPNTVYTFDLDRIAYYMTVTNAAAGVALRPPPASMRLLSAVVSESVPVRLPFSAGASQLRYSLDDTLTFTPATS